MRDLWGRLAILKNLSHYLRVASSRLRQAVEAPLFRTLSLSLPVPPIALSLPSLPSVRLPNSWLSSTWQRCRFDHQELAPSNQLLRSFVCTPASSSAWFPSAQFPVRFSVFFRQLPSLSFQTGLGYPTKLCLRHHNRSRFVPLFILLSSAF